jgi:hypothetical protein
VCVCVCACVCVCVRESVWEVVWMWMKGVNMGGRRVCEGDVCVFLFERSVND